MLIETEGLLLLSEQGFFFKSLSSEPQRDAAFFDWMQKYFLLITAVTDHP